MYILDTDTITHLHAGNNKVIENIRKVDDDDLRTTIVTKIELLRGRFDFLLKASDINQLMRAQKLLYRTEELLSQLPILPIDQKAALQFEQFRKINKFRKIGRADMLIGCITLANKAILVTRNVRHFHQIPVLLVKNWVD